MHKHKNNDRGCSEKKVDFKSTLIYKLGECGPDGLERVHGKYVEFTLLFCSVRDAWTFVISQISFDCSVKPLLCDEIFL